MSDEEEKNLIEEEEEMEEEKEEEEEETSGERKKANPFLKKFILALILILLIAGGSAYLTVSYVRKNPEPFGLLKGPSILKSEEKALVAEISKSLTLPKDEDPTIATVTDPEKLSSQFFFKDAQKGDKLLIYQNAKKVILYRPSENRVVEVGVVNVNNGSQAIPQPQSYKMVILNSTRDTGITATMQSKVSGIDGSVAVSETGNSVLTYNESLLVDVKGDKNELATKLSQGLEVKIGNLPDAEKKIDVDFILIIGADKI